MAAVWNSNIVEGGEDSEEEPPEMCSDPEHTHSHASGSRKNNAKPKSKRKKATTKSAGREKSDVASNGRTLDGNLLRLLRAHEQGRCLEAEKNDIYGNPGEQAKANCQQARRPLPCSSCDPSWDHSSNTSTIMSEVLFPAKLEDNNTHSPGIRIPTVPLPPPLTKAFREHATQKLLQFADERWALKEGPRFRIIPDAAFWPVLVLNHVLDQFHLLRSRESLDTHLSDWEFLSSDGDSLFLLLDRLNKRYDGRVLKSKELKARKAAATRARNKARKQHVDSAAMKENVPPALISAGTSCIVKTTMQPLRSFESTPLLTSTPFHYPLAMPSAPLPMYYPYTMPQPIPYPAPYSLKRYNAIPAEQQGQGPTAKRSRQF
ncbi:hypothetical protein M378DRAFT_13806 [Amanita muscaria Koide BX008]|uniref:Uncharacterized protein n=1 Tax=Amanita muscaria (strain Koide BX008) TaxID=946122 RepID=A0A0C2WW41_AMAMK|nr:hypothetical protein M378DRAFT_13806 [Amanita muscaria Koide BX008]